MKKLDYPLGPLVLVVVPGDRTEAAFARPSARGAISESAAPNPLVGSITTLALIMLVWPLLGAVGRWLGKPQRSVT